VFHFTAMLVGMQLGRFAGMVAGVQPVAVSDMGVVRRRLVIAFFVVLRGFAVVGRGVLVVLGRFAVVLSNFVGIHGKILLPNSKRDASQLDEVPNTVG
jgi:hypothetical protein